MDWYKMRHGMPYDPRLGLVARRLGVTRGVVLAVWLSLLDHASRQNPRGSLVFLDPEHIAAALDLDAAVIENAVAVLREKNIIAEDAFADWHATQMTSTDRVRAHRARLKNSRMRPARKHPPHPFHEEKT